ncbi:MAG: hypothetical protein PVG65_02710 [Candidatus Thorarchaeota archaeon]|jgi:hypothetical protein
MDSYTKFKLKAILFIIILLLIAFFVTFGFVYYMEMKNYNSMKKLSGGNYVEFNADISIIDIKDKHFG